MDELSLKVKENYEIQWRRPKIDLTDLAKKRWIENWPIKKIADELNQNPSTVRGVLWRLKKAGKLDELGFPKKEVTLISKN